MINQLKYIAFLLFSNVVFNSSAQGFDVDDTLKNIYKPTNSSTPPHEYFQLINNSGHPINMRWRVNQSQTYYPVQWTMALQDNLTYYNPIIDSSDFVLPDSAGTFDKIILNVYHNSFAGNGVVAIDLINLDSLAQVQTIYFVITIYQPLGLEENESFSIRIFPNPTVHFLQLESTVYFPENTSIKLLDEKGAESLFINTNVTNSIFLDLSGLKSGYYFLIIENEEFKTVQKICILEP